MVFSCVIVLALLSFVTATPHEYGAKPGAVAKAEANAAAGAFGVLPVIPLRIPSGSGYSGSYSKSSSSSFASSSSSASSSSYSFSGNNGIPGVGCHSGSCKNGESSIPSSLNGSPNAQIMHHRSEASAAAAAKASAESSSYFNSGSNAPCQQGNCKALGGSANCGTGLCDGSLQMSSNGESEIGLQANSENKQKCLSGNCFPNFKQQPDSTSISDDFEVNYDRNPKITSPTGYSESTSQSNNDERGSSSSLEKNSPKCNSPSCDTFLPLSHNNAQTFNPQKPAIHLVTPNLRPSCTTHNCKTDSTVSNENNGKPSSYNVPILGSNPSLQNSFPYNPSMTPLSNYPPQTGLEANCGSIGCMSNNAPEKAGFVGLKAPKYSHLHYPATPINSGNFGDPQQITTNIPFSCNTPNCGNFPVPNQPIKIKPNFITTPNNYNVPNYNNKISGAIGLTTIPSNSYANHNVPSYSEGFNGPKGPVNSAVYPGYSGTSQPNLVTISNNQNTPKYTNGFGGPPGPVMAAIYPGSLIKPKPMPNEVSTESNLPLYTGGFGGPPGSVTAAGPAGIFTTSKPNLNIKPNEPIYNNGFGGPIGGLNTATTLSHNIPVNTNSAMTLPTIAPNNFVQNSAVNPSGHSNTNKVNEKEKLPPYTGGFGGPSGILKPNEYNIPSKFASPTPAKPCTAFDCNKNSVSSEKFNNAGSSATASANADAVAYAGGFGAPPGLLQPDKSKTVNANSDFKGDHKDNQVNSQKNPGVLSDFNKQTNNKDTTSVGSQNNAESNAPGVNKNIQNNPDNEKEFNDFIQQANIADAVASAGAQTNVGGASHSVNKNQFVNSDENKMLNDYFAQANIADAVANIGSQNNLGGASHSVDKNKYDNSDEDKMLNDYFAQANIADAVASAGSQTKVADQDNFVALPGSNSNHNSGCNSNCRSHSNGGVVAGASASANSNAGWAGQQLGNSWASGHSFASSAATAHALAGASVKGGYGRR